MPTDKVPKMIWLNLGVALTITLLAEAWFLWPGKNWLFQWEPLVVFIASIGSFIGIQYNIFKTSSDKNIAVADVDLAKRIIAPFSENDAILFFRNHDFGNSYRHDDILPLNQLTNDILACERKFLNSRLENARKIVLTNAKELKALLGTHAFRLKNNNDIFRIYPDKNPMDQKRRLVIADIHKASSEFTTAYENFYDTVRAELGVEHAL